jgi:hypothetical protein
LYDFIGITYAQILPTWPSGWNDVAMMRVFDLKPEGLTGFLISGLCLKVVLR